MNKLSSRIWWTGMVTEPRPIKGIKAAVILDCRIPTVFDPRIPLLRMHVSELSAESLRIPVLAGIAFVKSGYTPMMFMCLHGEHRSRVSAILAEHLLSKQPIEAVIRRSFELRPSFPGTTKDTMLYLAQAISTLAKQIQGGLR